MSTRVLGGALGLLLFTGLGVYGWQGVIRLRHMHGQLDTLQRDNAALRQQAEELTQVIEATRAPILERMLAGESVEKIASEKHGMGREGEVILKFPSKDKASQ